MRLIVGLGNPDRKYEHTRHNLGFMAVQELARQHKGDFHKSAAINGLTARISVGSNSCSLLLPSTYMNNSGAAVKAAAVKSAIALEDILVVYDDMALPFESMRIRPHGSDGGHNGIKSIISHLGGKDFARLRLGIGRPRPGLDPADYVLNDFTAGEKKTLPDFINKALMCVHSWVTQGVEEAMNQFNTKSVTKGNRA